MKTLRRIRPAVQTARRPVRAGRAPTALSAALFRGLKLSLFLDFSAANGRGREVAMGNKGIGIRQ